MSARGHGSRRDLHQPVAPRGGPAAPPKRVIEDHPCPSAAPPPKAEDCGDLGTYRSAWWQSGWGWSWAVIAIVAALVLGRLVLIYVIAPLLSPAN